MSKRRNREQDEIAAREADLRAQGVPEEMINAPARTDMPRTAFRAYEADAQMIAEMPLDLRQAADELVILAYSTNRSPTRTARIIGYLALLEACLEGRASRTDVEAYMLRRQAELAGGPAESVRALLVAAQTAMSASKDSELDEDTIRAVCEARALERRLLAAKQDLGDFPAQTVVCPEHGYPHTYGEPGPKRDEEF